MSDEYPGEEPGTAAPTWAAVPTVSWTRVPEQRRDEAGRGGHPHDQHPAAEQWADEPRRPRIPQQPPGRGQVPYADPRQQPRPQGAPDDPRRSGPPPHWSQGQPQPYQAQPRPGAQGYGPPRGFEDPHRQGYGPPPQRPADPYPVDPYAGQPGYGRPAQGHGQGRPRNPALDEPTDEVPRVPRARRGAAAARPAGRATVYGTPVSAPPTPGGRVPGRATVYGAPASGAPAGTAEAFEASAAPVSSAPVSAAPSPSESWFGDSPAPAEELTDPGPVTPQPPAALGGYRSAPLTGAGVDGLQATGYLPIVRPGADGFPPELAALMPTSPAPKADAKPEETAGPDPEQILAGYEWRFDPDTLREQVEGEEVDELTEIRDLLTAKLNGVADNPTRARLLSLRAVVSRILGDLPKAFADGKLALAHAEATGELRRIAIAQARLAHVLQWREEFDEADRLFTLANSSELPDRLRATMHQHAGKCAYDQGRYMEACNHFERALDLRKEEDPELIAQTELALDAVFRRVAEKGWGPYPRSRDEILQIRKAPSPAFDEQTQRWGYIEPDGNFCIGPGYLDVQPFRDGVAWVQRQGEHNWELIDDTGRTLIEPSAGYLGVSSFSDGIAWVSRDGTTRWIAIDKTNAVLISTGYDDVRPFRRGVAAVRRGEHWGAVDGVGRVVVSFQYDGFATALLDGRYIDGFSDEGLAVVSLDGRKGVVDRSGRVIVPPIHHTLMIHPVAFLIADDAQRWGALDRRGRTVIEATFPSRTGVTDEIDRLLADTRPVM